MSEATLTCIHCKQELFEQLAGSEPPQFCPGCDRELRLALFPAWYRVDEGKADFGRPVVSDEASCFYHEKKQAITSCDECGRFLCSLCDLELGEKHLCTKCLESGAKKGKLVDLENQRTRYDRLAGTLAVVSLLFFFVAPILSAVGIGMIAWKWKAPPSREVNTRLRMSLLLVLLIMEFIGGAAVWYGIYGEL